MDGVDYYIDGFIPNITLIRSLLSIDPLARKLFPLVFSTKEAMLPSKEAHVLAMLELAAMAITVASMLLELAAVMVMVTRRTVVVSAVTVMAMAQVMRAVGCRRRRTAGNKQRSSVTVIATLMVGIAGGWIPVCSC